MILTIFKIIGIVVLIIIGIFILFVGNVLFFPIRYEVKGTYEQAANMEARITWFPIFLRITATIKENKFSYVVRALGGVILTNTDLKRSILGRMFFPEEGLNRREDSKTDKTKDKPVANKENQTKDSKKENLENSNTVKKNKFSLENIKLKLEKLGKKRDALKKVSSSKRFEKAKKDVIIYVKKLLSILKPKTFQGRLHFGLEDPAVTGELTGMLAMFLPLYYDCFELEPEFEFPCLEGELYGKGRFALFPILILALKVIFNKNLIKVTKKVQTIMER